MNELVAHARGGELTEAEKRAELIRLVLDSVGSKHSKRAYRTGLEQFFAWWGRASPGMAFSRALVQGYRSHLESEGKTASTINQRLAPIRKLAEETAASGWFALPVAADVRSVKGVKQRGTRTGNWLTAEEAERLLAAPNRSLLAGKRDSALLSLFVGAGLRREELAQLKQSDIQRRNGRWCIVDIEGKGKRIRTVAIPGWVKSAVEEWLAAVPVGMELVLGKVNKGGRFVGEGLSAAAIYAIVLAYAKQIDVPIRPHDLRRTYGRLAHEGGARLEQIQISFGHASVLTTEKYLGVQQDLVDAPCDHLRLQVKGEQGT